MQDFEEGECLGPFEEGEECFEETFKSPMRKHDWNKERCAEGDGGPLREADSVVGEKVSLFSSL